MLSSIRDIQRKIEDCESNKDTPQVVWDAQDLMFSMPEPGVYMLQMGGSISGANVVAKMVNDDVEAEVVTLEGSKDTVFRCRSTIFTVEDDDHEAERLLVEVCINE